MRDILKFDFQKENNKGLSREGVKNYTKKDPILHVTTTVSLKQGTLCYLCNLSYT